MTTSEQPPGSDDSSFDAEIRRAFESEAGPSPRVRQAVMARLNASQANIQSAGFFSRLLDWLRVPAAPRWAPAAALVLAVIPAGLLLRQAGEPIGAAPPVTARGISNSLTRLNVRFNPQATDAQIRELLVSLGAQIVGGPNPAGEFVIELMPASPAVLAQKLSAARAHPEVLLSLDIAAP